MRGNTAMGIVRRSLGVGTLLLSVLVSMGEVIDMNSAIPDQVG
jgi:hypothetical protein